MSRRNGDKSRFGRERKQKLLLREQMRALRATLKFSAQPKPAA